MQNLHKLGHYAIFLDDNFTWFKTPMKNPFCFQNHILITSKRPKNTFYKLEDE